MSKALAKKIDALELKAAVATATTEGCVISFVCPKSKESISTYKWRGSRWEATQEKPTAYFALKLEPLFLRPKRFNVIVGGRGSGKSVGVAGMVALEIQDRGNSWFCLREYQSSITDSVHSLLKDEYSRLELEGFNATDTTITNSSGGKARFAGIARNSQSIKSASGFKGFWTEEAQTISASSLKDLTPTARNKPKRGLPDKMVEINDSSNLDKVKQVFTANPGSSEDPLSKRFINPFKEALYRDGIYEDDLHLVIKMDWSDNPWYEMSGLEGERAWDYENLPRALYDHIWEGEFNDSLENAIISREWFDACIDAHVKLGFKPQGAIIATHDPSDGGDNKGYALRHGSVFIDIQEKTDGDVNEGMDWALDIAIGAGADFFAWDGDGMGAPLRRNADNALQGKKCTPVMFRGSEGPYMPDAIYQPTANTTIRQSAKIKDVFRNKRSQCYIRLQDRVYNTYRAVVHGEYCDPDEMISFSSDIKCMGRLRSEVCRLPLKPNGNGFIQMMTKIEMKKLDIPSPGLSDSVMMSLGDFTVMKTRTSRAPRARKLHR